MTPKGFLGYLIQNPSVHSLSPTQRDYLVSILDKLNELENVVIMSNKMATIDRTVLTEEAIHSLQERVTKLEARIHALPTLVQLEMLNIHPR